MTMKVYKSEYTGGYGGGCVVIAANSEEEAHQLAASDKCNNNYNYRGYDYDSGKEELCYDYVVSCFREIEGLTYNGKEPTILIDNIYYE